MPLKSCYVLSPKPFIVVIGMNTRIPTFIKTEEEMDNVGDQDNQVPPHEEVAMGNQVPVIPPSMTDGEISASIISFDQAINS